ncbi:hypothetical protein [Sphingomonas sp. CV7422]|uniref:hypothetical protein n=1 Tax=Sphingomonas sp. CV7422 TaxID=3018036 RepID=UPI0022FDFC37|nr:hypothetical protein [Sphingomonas sp. CV7422]
MGAQVLFAPIDRAGLRRARRAALAVLGRDEHEGSESGSAEEQVAELGDALSHALLMQGIIDWKDVCLMADGDDAGPGEVLECTDENKALVLSDPLTFEAFDAAYVIPFVVRERAKNAFAASPSGTGAAATEASDIAPSPATPAPKAGAKRAPTARKPRRTKMQKSSGTS